MTDMRTREVVSVGRPADPRLEPGKWWSVVYRTEAGEHLAEHRFPHETLHWRAAEYGLDPADAESLLEIVLHEPFIDTSHTSPDFLYNTDQATARTAHLAKIKAASVRIADPQNLLRTIHQAHTVDPADHAARVAHVQAIRNGNRAPHFRLAR